MRAFSNSEMSAPETKALSPAPVTTTTRIAGSFSNSSRMTGIASHMSVEVALCLCRLVEDEPADRARLLRDHVRAWG